jgi:hypothetical protein
MLELLSLPLAPWKPRIPRIYFFEPEVSDSPSGEPGPETSYGNGCGTRVDDEVQAYRRIGVSEGNSMGYATWDGLNPHLRRLPLYPTELRARPVDFTAHSLPSQRIGDSLCGESSV